MSRFAADSLLHLGLPQSVPDLSRLEKSDERKVRLAILLIIHTSMSDDWSAGELAMGIPVRRAEWSPLAGWTKRWQKRSGNPKVC